MSNKVIFLIAIVTLGFLGILAAIVSDVPFFYLVVMVFLFLIAIFVGYSIHQINETHRQSRKQLQAAQKVMVEKSQRIQMQVDAIVSGLRSANEVLGRHEKYMSDLSDGNAVSFKRVRNDIKATKDEQSDSLHAAQQVMSQPFTLYYDSLRNVLEDFETYRVDHGTVPALSTVDSAESLARIEKSFESLEQGLRSSFRKGNQTLFNRLQIAMYDETQETEALLHLQSKIEPRAVLPSLGRWAMDAKSMLQLVDLFDAVQPKLIVEIGSGTSSVWLGYLAEKGCAQVVSIENDKEFAGRTRAIIADHGLEETVNVIYAPLADLEIGGEEFIWYQTEFVGHLSNIDLLIVDGPPGSTAGNARYPALPMLADKLSPGAVVVLDDTHRKDEAQIAERWAMEYSLERVDRAMSRLAILKKVESE